MGPDKNSSQNDELADQNQRFDWSEQKWRMQEMRKA
jgi:hypothetical protein